MSVYFGELKITVSLPVVSQHVRAALYRCGFLVIFTQIPCVSGDEWSLEPTNVPLYLCRVLYIFYSTFALFHFFVIL